MGYPPRQLFALGLAGVITEMNGAHHHELGSWGLNEHTRPWCKNTLKKFYGIETQQDFDEMIEFLWKEGASAEAREVVASLGPSAAADTPKQAEARANAAEIQRVGLLAWDMGRMSAVIGWGFWTDFITEEAAWHKLLLASFRCQQGYDSWRSFGQAYEMGRLFWAQGKAHEATAKALDALTSKPDSPWVKLPWDTDLGVQTSRVPGKQSTRFKKSVCAHCGGHKTRPSATAYVYCDYCGELCDFDFQRSCETTAPPGPAYEQLRAQVVPALMAAQQRADANAYRAAQEQLFDGFVAACPLSVSPRAGDARYRKAYVAYMAEAATLAAFDPATAQADAAMNAAVQRLAFVQGPDGKPRVVPATFEQLLATVQHRRACADALYQQAGTYGRHPDGAPRELQNRIDWSLFAQGWLPYLDNQGAQRLLGLTSLQGDYVPAGPPAGEAAACACCGARLTLMPGARRVVCEHCGHRLEVGGARLRCTSCGLALAPEEGQTRVNCPACKAELQRM